MYNKITTVFTTFILLTLVMLGSSMPKTGTATNGKELMIERNKNDRSPLYVVNSTVLTSKKARKNYLRIKPTDFRDISVLDVDELIQKYGTAGKYGTVEVQLTDSTKAYTNLLSTEKEPNIYEVSYRSSNQEVIREPKVINGFLNLQRQLEYPQKCRDANVEGQLTVTFKFNKKGQVEDPSILRGIGWGCDEAVIQLLNRRAKFLPGLVNGKPVNVRYSMPFMFQLN